MNQLQTTLTVNNAEIVSAKANKNTVLNLLREEIVQQFANIQKESEQVETITITITTTKSQVTEHRNRKFINLPKN